nr:unnamed protein product [Digitaria exilis]
MVSKCSMYPRCSSVRRRASHLVTFSVASPRFSAFSTSASTAATGSWPDTESMASRTGSRPRGRFGRFSRPPMRSL